PPRDSAAVSTALAVVIPAEPRQRREGTQEHGPSLFSKLIRQIIALMGVCSLLKEKPPAHAGGSSFTRGFRERVGFRHCRISTINNRTARRSIAAADRNPAKARISIIAALLLLGPPKSGFGPQAGWLGIRTPCTWLRGQCTARRNE